MYLITFLHMPAASVQCTVYTRLCLNWDYSYTIQDTEMVIGSFERGDFSDNNKLL